MKTQSMAFNLAFLLLSCLAVPVLACCPPPQPPCYRCEDGVWVWACGAGNCCGGSCCYATCCNGVCCSAGQNCCGGVCCDPAKCCNGVCCPAGQICCGGACSYGCSPPCGPCQTCNLETCYCDDLCVACQECVEGSCISCAALGKVCCDGWCYPPCVQTSRNTCDTGHSLDYPCIGCTVPPFYYCDDFTTRIYTGNTPHWCSEGCPLDCDWVDDVHCHTEYQCTVEEDYLAICSTDPEGPLGVRCKPFPGLSCAHCIRNIFDPGEKYYVTSKECH